MPLCISFWHYFVSVTNAPVSLLVNLFFFSLFSLLGWDIFISSMGFLFLHRAVCISAFLSACLCQLLAFVFANKPNQKYLYINKARSCLKVAHHWETANPLVLFEIPMLSLNPSLKPCHCAASCFGVYVWVEGQEMDELRRWKGIQAHVAAATLEPQSSVSVAESPRPSICPCALKGTFVPPQGSFRTHTHR